MGWEIGFDPNWARDIGYGVPAICDHPGCNEKIHRGMAYACSYDEGGCGLFFCAEHRYPTGLCSRCQMRSLDSFDPKDDTEEWINHKLTDPSWAKWREENRDAVEAYNVK